MGRQKYKAKPTKAGEIVKKGAKFIGQYLYDPAGIVRGSYKLSQKNKKTKEKGKKTKVAKVKRGQTNPKSKRI